MFKDALCQVWLSVVLEEKIKMVIVIDRQAIRLTDGRMTNTRKTEKSLSVQVS